MKKNRVLMIVALGLVVFVSSCARLQQPVTVEGGQNIVRMTASDFKFQPNNVTTRAGQSILFQIQNVTGTSHNFTLKDPDGGTVQNVDIPAKQSVDIKVTFSRPGTYKFYCDRTGHSQLGMKGQVVATGR